MTELDFSTLDRLSYGDCKTDTQRQEKDALIEKGFTFLEAGKTPFDAPQTPEAVKTQPSERPAQKALKPLVGHDGTDCRKFYRLACNFHEKYAPSPDTPESWEKAAREMVEISESNGQNEFLRELLFAVFNEFEREYKHNKE